MDAAATTTLPYSTANTKGQCIRHPSIQLKQKKTFGSGYKTITSICPMCAMELMSIEGDNHQDDDCGRGQVGQVVSSSTSVTGGWDASSIHASAQRSNSSTRTTQQQQHHRSSRSRHSKQRSDDVSIKSAPSTYNREPHRHTHRESSGTNNNNIESTSSFGHSSRSCGSHHRHRPSTSNTKQYYSHEIPSCDSSTMSLSVSSRSSLSSRSSSSQGGGSSHRSTSSSSSAASYTSSHSGQSHRSNNNSHHPPQQQHEGYVCGLQYNNGYYTGQIDIGTNLPHGLGSLRDRQGVICNEGQWHYGRLVESSLPPSRTAAPYAPRQQDAYNQQQEKKTNNFEQYIVNSSSEEDESSSACSTVHTDDEDSSSIPSVALSSQSSSSSSSWTSNSRHSSSSSSSTTTTRRLHSPSSPKYSARESKNTTLSLVPQDKFKSSSRTSSQARTSVATGVPTVPQAAATGKQVTYNKLQEYQNYIDMCDDNEDWYLENQEHGGKSRRVRFRE